MISPASFGFDAETAQSNTFQTKLQASNDDITLQALAEFNQTVYTLDQAGVNVVVHRGDPSEQKPNAVFPNNWLSTWPNGQVFLYPMATSSRRVERDQKVLDQITQEFMINRITDLSTSENFEKYLESTGVIIFDHLNKIAYGCVSVRCDEQLFTNHVSSLGYQPVAFHAYDQSGVPVYHTNVMMGVQSTTAVLCSETITNAAEKAKVLDLLQRSRQVVDISIDQMLNFCGNVLEVENQSGEKILVMSQSAFEAFSQDQLAILSADKTLLTLNIPTIEKIGGGSARCMLAEIFLPKLAS